MGGMIAQHLAAHHPARVKSLTLIMTTSGARGLVQPSWRVRQALMARPRSADPADVIQHMTSVVQLIGSPAHRPDPVRTRQRIEAAVRRAYRPAGTARQLMAIVADGDRSSLLGRITTPTTVIHGAADVLVPPAGGQDLANKIGGATLDMVPGMGHDLPLPLLPRIAEGIARVAARTGLDAP
jgi:pimeloyl-ACP methyl ester carboxylesterase